MKTLNEVIMAKELCELNCSDEGHCQDCPYAKQDANGDWSFFCYDCEADALHYLKKYRDNFEARNSQVERYQKAAKECEEILTDYVALKQYWAEQQANPPLTWDELKANPPLTWDELKAMEGKPVWIEAESISVGVSPYWKDWYIIKSFSDDEFMHCNDGYEWAKETQGRLWQAYRKEKYELDQKAH